MILRCENLTLGYGKADAVVKDLGFGLEKGELMTLIGPNGSGKSTVLKALAGAVTPRRGAVYVKETSLTKIKPRDLARIQAFLPQSPKSPDDYTVRDLIGYGREPHLRWMGRMTEEDWAIVDWAIRITHLDGMQERAVADLSGGERQRAWIALALAQKPEILILDEPTTYLDICYQFEIMELVKKLNEELGISVIMVLHDLNQAARYSHRIVALHKGRLAADGKPENVITPGFMEAVFRIRVRIFEDPVHKRPYFVPVESLTKISI